MVVLWPFWTPPAPYGWLAMARMVRHHHPIYVTSLLIHFALVICINVVPTAKKVARKAKMAILWPFLTPSCAIQWLEMARLVPYHHPIYVIRLLVLSVPVLSINVFIAAKKVARKVKKYENGHIMAIFESSLDGQWPKKFLA